MNNIKINKTELNFNPRQDDAIKANPSVAIKKRNNKNLLIEPETGSWIVLNAAEYSLFKRISTPHTIKQLLQTTPQFFEFKLKNLIKELYLQQMISINHVYFYPPHIFKNNYTPGYYCLRATDRCNFKCKYCYTNSSPDKPDMELKTMLEIIKKVVTNNPHEKIMIEFHGGEPILVLQNIIKAAHYGYTLAKKHKKTLIFCAMSNGSLITPHIFEILKKNRISTGISLDGDEVLHDKNRQYPNGNGTYNAVYKNYSYILKQPDKYKNFTINKGLLTVVNEPGDFIRTYEFYMENDIKNFTMHLPFLIGRALINNNYKYENYSSYAKEFIKIVKKVLRINKVKGICYLNFNDVRYWLENILTKSRDNMCMRSPCGAGNSIVAFDHIGNIYPCEVFIDFKEYKMANIFEVNSLHEYWMNNPLNKRLNERIIQNTLKCKTCTWKNFCGGGCAARSLQYTQNIFREDPFCYFFAKVLEELLWAVSENPDDYLYLLKEDFIKKHCFSYPSWKPSLQ